MELPPSVDFSLPEADSEELIRDPVCRMHTLSLPKSGGAPLSRPLRGVLRPSEVIGAIGGVSRETPPHRATDESPSPPHSIANRGVYRWHPPRPRTEVAVHPQRASSRAWPRDVGIDGERSSPAHGVSRETYLPSKRLLRSGAPDGGPRCEGAPISRRYPGAISPAPDQRLSSGSGAEEAARPFDKDTTNPGESLDSPGHH